MNLQNNLIDFINDPHSSLVNFDLANSYYEIGQTSSAYSYYLRAGELSDDIDLIYKSLLKAGECLGKQKDHDKSQEGMYMHALSVNPNRPEAYYFLSVFNESRVNWISAYSMACVGISNSSDLVLSIYDNYPGHYALIFQKAVSSWWIGKHEESKLLFENLFENYEDEMNDYFKELVHNNLVFLNSNNFPMLLYTSLVYKKLRCKFNNADTIKQNYSQAYQDMFVLSMLDGKFGGTYLEIGSSDPFKGNNTALLETKFNWTGVSIDIDKNEVDKFKKLRSNTIILSDATVVDYNKILCDISMKDDIDYLQIDCDPPSVTYDILTKIPFDKYKFAVITYEHDYHVDETKQFRSKSRILLKSKGYELVVSDIAPNDTDTFEDWWVYPSLVNRNNVKLLKNTSSSIKNVSKCMLFR